VVNYARVPLYGSPPAKIVVRPPTQIVLYETTNDCIKCKPDFRQSGSGHATTNGGRASGSGHSKCKRDARSRATR
jgi:hypothetical protein